MIKTGLLIFLFFTCSFLGILKNYSLSKRVFTLKEIRDLFFMMRNEIFFSKKDIYSISERLESVDEIGFLEYMTNRNFTPEENYIYAKKEIGKSLFLEKNDWKILDSFFMSLGKTNFENQKDIILKNQELLENAIVFAEDKNRKYSKLYTAAGVLSGLFLVIILL